MTKPIGVTPSGHIVFTVESAAPVAPSPLRLLHLRAPTSPDPKQPRIVDLDTFLAIEPSAAEKAFFDLFFDDERDAYQMIGTVAVLSIDGPLTQRGTWRYAGYNEIQESFTKALNDKGVTAIVLKINSPGGVCSGCFSTVRAMLAAKAESRKPVIAYADENAYSAAYAMACVADEIYLPPEGGVGSVGVMGVLEDWTGFNEKAGIKVAVVTSGAQKADGHEDVPLTEAVIARYQARINMLAQAFASIVATSRRMTSEAVLGLEAACLYGQEAIDKGLADGISTFDQTVERAQQLGVANTVARTLIIHRNV